jgi:hypothetical protein
LVEVTLGGKNVNLKVPIAIQDFNLKGRVRDFEERISFPTY